MEVKFIFMKKISYFFIMFLFCFFSLDGFSDLNKTKEEAENNNFLKDSVLILSTDNNASNDIVSGIQGEIGDDFKINLEYYSKLDFDKNMLSFMMKYEPNILVLLGNENINSYLTFRDNHPKIIHPPVILLAALYIDKLAIKFDNVSGIRYEIPLVTSGVNLRSLSVSPIKKIGVIHREWLTEYVNVNAEYALSEGIEIVSVVLPSDSAKMDRLVKKEIKKLSYSVDAFWILNDNKLLTKKIILNAWIPELNRYAKPVIVGVESLVETKFKIGTLSVSPDHYALGVQAASKILDIQYDNWILDGIDIEQPLSVKKVFNQVVSEQRKIDVNESRFGELDRVIK